jgi:undecaprenyl diphosphate synthase
MKQSALEITNTEKVHVGIIMDGNGRWATRKGKSRLSGHRQGALAVRRVVEAAPSLGIGTLTLYAFSSDNWQRPETEVNALFSLLRRYLQSETANCVKNGVRISFVGRRDRLGDSLKTLAAAAESATENGTVLHLRLAVDYSARDSIIRAAKILSTEPLITREMFSKALGSLDQPAQAAPDVDLLIRTGGEQRLSDFLLWESAYAELYFTQTMWPDFGKEELSEALTVFHSRDRRFGRLSAPDEVSNTKKRISHR